MNSAAGGRSEQMPVLLEQLHDIQTPVGVSFWPLAPGWWLLLGCLLLLLLSAARYYLRWTELRRVALRELRDLYRQFLAQGDAPRYAMGVSTLLRRVALTRTPRRQVAGLTGSDWLAFLDRSGNTDEFSRGAGAVLAKLPYRSGGQLDAQALNRLVENWLKRNT